MNYEMPVDYFYSGLLAGIFSFIFSFTIIKLFKRLKISDYSIDSLQASHTSPTSRLGGMALIITLLFFSFFYDFYDFNWLWISLMPIFVLGLLEDFHYSTSSKLRIFVGSISVLIGVYLSGINLTSIDIEPLENLIAFPLISLFLTVFAIVGLTNAINLIDGVNGFALGYTLISSIALFFVSLQFKESEITQLCILLFFSSLGVFLLNFPNGRIFTGDAGAYSIGFILGWLMIVLAEKNTLIAKWSLLSIVVWPVSDTIYSIYRRRINKAAPDKADFLHFHHVVMRAWKILSRGRISQEKANPMATITILPLATIPPTLGVIFIKVNWIGILIVTTTALTYVLIYKFLILALKSSRFRNLFRV